MAANVLTAHPARILPINRGLVWHSEAPLRVPTATTTLRAIARQWLCSGFARMSYPFKKKYLHYEATGARRK